MLLLYSDHSLECQNTGGTGLGLYSLSKRMDALGGGYGVHDRKDGTFCTLLTRCNGQVILTTEKKREQKRRQEKGKEKKRRAELRILFLH